MQSVNRSLARVCVALSASALLFGCMPGGDDGGDSPSQRQPQTGDGGDDDSGRIGGGVVGSGGDGGGAGGTGGEAGGGGDAGASGGGGVAGGGGDGGTGGAAGSGGGQQPGAGQTGAPCERNQDCEGGFCITDLPGGYCSQICDEARPCPNEAPCWNLGLDDSLCLRMCGESNECREDEGYVCDTDDTCFPGGAPPDNNIDCRGVFECFQNCADGDQECLQACYASATPAARGQYDDIAACANETGCVDGPEDCQEVCSAEFAVCLEGGPPPPPCTPDSCPEGTICADSGRCVIELGDPPAGPIPACNDIPSWSCTGGEAACGRIEQFLPEEGPGYWNYPLNGERADDQYRSFCRRDMMTLIKHAAAAVDCLAADWPFGNHEPLGLGDMSEADGSIPGTRENQPGHPEGTHTNGFDMDIGYFQIGSPDNRLRPICEHTVNGRDQYHCVSPPELVDMWRTALFLGKLHDTPQLRVIGVDGQVGPLVESAMDQLCDNGWLDGNACNPQQRRLAYEVEDQQRGWYRFHHHHLHVSMASRRQAGLDINLRPLVGALACLRPDCARIDPETDPRRRSMVPRIKRMIGSLR